MDEQTVRGWLKDQQDRAETLAQQQAAAFQLQFDALRVELHEEKRIGFTLDRSCDGLKDANSRVKSNDNTTRIARIEENGDNAYVNWLGFMLSSSKEDKAIGKRSFRVKEVEFWVKKGFSAHVSAGSGSGGSIRLDPDSWIIVITKYFSLLNTLADERLRIMGFNLEGAAAEWFRWMTRNGLITDWARFVKSVKSHFGPSKVTDIPDSLLISFYILGLKLNLQHELLVSRPTTLGDAFSLARIIEARFEAIAKKEKEQIVKKKTDAIIPLQSELASPKIKGSLNADKDIGVDELSSAIDGVFDMGESNVESMEVRSNFGEFSKNKKSVEEVLGGGETLGVDEDNESGNAATDEGDNAVEGGDISILNSLIGGDKEVQYYVYTLYVLIPFLKRFNDKYIKKNKMKAAMQRRL
ncbi:hypothetical protein Tco_0240495 [Tanacetum coccineum]